MNFNQLMKVAAHNNLQQQRKLDERRRRQAESEAAEKKNKNPVISLDAVKAHLPKKPELPPVVRPVKKRRGRSKEDDLKLDDRKKSAVMSLEKPAVVKQQNVDIKTKDAGPSETEKKEKGSRDRVAAVNTAKERKPMNFLELMRLARRQKDVKTKGKEKETEMKTVTEVAGKTYARKGLSSKGIEKPIHEDEEKEKPEGKVIWTGMKYVNGSQQIKVASKLTSEKATQALSTCTMTSTTIEKSPHQFHNKRKHDKRNRESNSEEPTVKRLHVNPYLSVDDLPVKKTQQTKTSKKRHHLLSEELDFIDDDNSEDIDVSSHIREIFGYDRRKYEFENPSTASMEASYRDIMKEEKMRIGHLEDLEEERKERERMAKHKKKKR